MVMKKTVIGTLCVVCMVLGVYVRFFDRPPISETLSANRGSVVLEKPVFPHKFNNFASSSHRVDEGEAEKTIHAETPKIDDKNENNVMTETEKQPPYIYLQKTINTENVENESSGEVLKSEPVEKTPEYSKDELKTEVEGNDETQIELNGKNTKVAVQDTDEYSRHNISKFDWEGWVKENNFVEVGTIWAYCDTEDEPPVVGKVVMLNDDGLQLTVVLNTTFAADVTFGKVGIHVEYGTTTVFEKLFDLCELHEKDDFFTCPMQKGPQYFVREQGLPRFVPSGEYNVEGSMTDEYDNILLCFHAKFKI